VKHKSIDIFVYKTNITNRVPTALTSKVKTNDNSNAEI